MNVAEIDAPVGAVITDVDLSRELSDADIDGIYRAVTERNVVIIPGQSLTPAQQAAFSGRFGPLISHASFEYNHPEHDKVLIISNIKEEGRPIGIEDAGSYWHSDFSYIAKPSFATILYGVEIPEGRGDTLFINMYAAYDALDDDMKARIEGLQARHWHVDAGGRWGREFRPDDIPAPSAEQDANLDKDFRAAAPAVHPIVKVHPDTGRRCLYVHPCFTHDVVGLGDEESDELLRALFTHMTQPRFQWRHKWSKDDVVMWDNRCTTHAATTSALPGSFRRRLHRTSVEALRH